MTCRVPLTLCCCVCVATAFAVVPGTHKANVACPYEMKAEEHPMAVPVFAQAGDVYVSFDLQQRKMPL